MALNEVSLNFYKLIDSYVFQNGAADLNSEAVNACATLIYCKYLILPQKLIVRTFSPYNGPSNQVFFGFYQ